jgi:N-methylhydantoinase B
MPERLAASSGGDVPGFMMVGHNLETGRMYAVSNNDPVGWGGTPTHDGINATNHISGSLVRNTPIEVMEMKTGMFIESLEMRTDSAGAGKYRGGVGIRRDIRFVAPGEFLSVLKKSRTRPWALAGGLEPEPNCMLLFPGSSKEKRVGTKRVRVQPDDAAICLTAGGGGYGDPSERDPARVLEDVLNGYVSTRAASDMYKVAIKDGKVDVDGTNQLRADKSL